MNAQEIRDTFIRFFESKGHAYVPSSPIVVKNDPTLMFTNAGMNQFKDYFLGNDQAAQTRVANSQKCLRVSGKHNDLEEVGVDTYHHTMFEMLGNWSFGDYFKKEAITWAWELLTEVYKLPKEQLYVSVFGGDAQDKLDRDMEAFGLWEPIVGADRIIFGSKKDNFWEMGDTGPCGPCSEIHIDLRPAEERAAVSGYDLVNADHPQVIEIWNLVFMQFNRLADGSLKELPAKHVDTGMGFERLVRAIQNKSSNYDTDVFMPFIAHLEKRSGIAYGKEEKTDIAMRVIVDHIRAIAFTIADGQLPSNNKAGYVIRRILRRAVRYGYTFLQFDQPFLHELMPLLAQNFGKIFPEVAAQEAFITKVIQEEEAAFLRTLENGLRLLETLTTKLQAEGSRILPGAQVFELYDTFGFPVDLTSLIAREQGFSIDEAGFQQAMDVQKNRSRAAAEQETGDWVVVGQESSSTFVGYDHSTRETVLTKYRTVKEKKHTRYQVVLAETPFYAESGGQVGDTGWLTVGTERIHVLDTKKENDLIVHFVDKVPGDPSQPVYAEVDTARRQLITYNHTATHLLQAALRQVLGEHIQQKGSLVNERLLRFDFAHFSKLTEEELQQVEGLVNAKIRENIVLEEYRAMPIEEAKAMGATALFGEKYGDQVRVICFDKAYSMELCGGIHVPATGHIGYFKITSETAIAAGVRRIEAVTAAAAEQVVQAQGEALEEVKALLKHPKDVSKAIQALLDERQELRKTIEQFQLEQVKAVKGQLLQQQQVKEDATYILAQVRLPHADALKKLAYELKQEVPQLVLVLAADIEGKPQVAVMLDEQVLEAKSLHAGKLVKTLAQSIKGGGGGQDFFATAGGKALEGLPQVIPHAEELLGLKGE